MTQGIQSSSDANTQNTQKDKYCNKYKHFASLFLIPLYDKL